MRNRKRILAALLALACLLLPAASGAEEAGFAEGVLKLVLPYYESAVDVAVASPEQGRFYTDHKIAHAAMVAYKSLEVADAIRDSAFRGALSIPPVPGRIVLSGELDDLTLEGAALFHDTGMCGGGYALVPVTDESGNALRDEQGQVVYQRTEDGLFRMLPEDMDNFGEVRSFHSFTSGMYVLVNREALRTIGYTDLQIDKMALECMAHSKSNSGVRDLNSPEDWALCFDRMDSLVAAWNADHDQPISFDRRPFETDDVLMGSLASETLALRLGDVSRDSGPDAEVQSGETVFVDRSSINDRGGTVEAEVENAVAFIGEEREAFTDPRELQIHAGEQNITGNRTYADEEGRVVHEITVDDGCSAPRCTQTSVNDHLGELYSARDGRFRVVILFTRFEAEDRDFFIDSWEDYRLEAAQAYPNVTISFSWTEEVLP